MISVSCTKKPLDVLNGFQQFWRRKGNPCNLADEITSQSRRREAGQINYVGAANKG